MQGRYWQRLGWLGLWAMTLCLTSCGDAATAPPAKSDAPAVVREDRDRAPAAPRRSEKATADRGEAATAAPDTAPSSETTRRAAGAAEPISVTNVTALKRRVGDEVTVVGRVSTANRAQSGHQFLNFYSSELKAICFKEDAQRFGKQQPADTYAERDVVLSGKLELYQGKLQIKLRRPEQIRLADEASEVASDGAGSATEPGDAEAHERASRTSAAAGSTDLPAVQLKQLGEDSWLSPAGVIYRGHDPEGLTRLDHVLRHAEDDPERAGSHGVFDGGRNQALRVIDEAWKKIKAQRIKPELEAGREAYTVPMGRRVGYLGGESGARRRHPPLSRVLIVVREGTSEVVTAFPK